MRPEDRIDWYRARLRKYEKALEYYAGLRGHPVSGVIGRDAGEVARVALAWGRDVGQKEALDERRP